MIHQTQAGGLGLMQHVPCTGRDRGKAWFGVNQHGSGSWLKPGLTKALESQNILAWKGPTMIMKSNS